MTHARLRFRTLIRDAFDGEVQFVTALDSACRTVVNKTSLRAGAVPLSAPDLLAKYCDLCLKRSKQFASDAEIEEKMTALIVIFQYVDDKDIFQKYYSKMLAKRLIHGTSASDEAEVGCAEMMSLRPGMSQPHTDHRYFEGVHDIEAQAMLRL